MSKFLWFVKIIIPVIGISSCAHTLETGHSKELGELIGTTIVHLGTPDGRDIDVKLFYKEAECRGCPLIVFSHGANATYDRYDVIIHHWVREGFVVAAPLHVDSEEYHERERYTPDRHLPTRIEDFSLVASSLHEKVASVLPKLRISEDYIAAGHSFGALIAQIAGGAVVSGNSIDAVKAPSAIIAISPPGAVEGIIAETAWSSVSKPMLVVTGTDDVVPFVAPTWQDHLTSYEMAPPGMSIALVFDGIDHYFNGAFGRVDDVDGNEHAVEYLNKATTAFMQQSQSGVSVSEIKLWQEYPDNVEVFQK